MSQSLSSVILHLVFSTKGRLACIGPSMREGLYAFLAGAGRQTGCECFRVGGTADHVHLAVRFGRTLSIAQLVEDLKTSSSKWIKAQSSEYSRFAWQSGYGVFSVAHSDEKALVNYIDNQAEHHKTRTFQQEYRAFLTKYQVDYDERYVWD